MWKKYTGKLTEIDDFPHVLCSVRVKILGFEIYYMPNFKSQSSLTHCMDLASYYNSLHFIFLLCKIGMILIISP